jgi:nitrite reductase/ring-hydroxylating ferredoxin subunit
MAGERAARWIEGQWWLDTPSYKIEHGIALTFNLLGSGSHRVQDFLHGTWLGHALHPLITDIPVGAWTAALALDAIDVSRPRRFKALDDAARACVGLGIAGAVAAALTGTADWQHTQDNARRVGLVHGILNTAALGFYGMSWNQRLKGCSGRGRRLSVPGYLLVLVSGYLGGNLVFRHKVGVDHSDKGVEPRRFTPTLGFDELEPGKPTRVQCADVDVVLLRDGENVFAVGEHCPHLGAPMDKGWLYRGQLVCPWHGSRFDPDDGTPLKGPATAPLTAYETRLRDGRIEVRRTASTGTAPPQSAIEDARGTRGRRSAR